MELSRPPAATQSSSGIRKTTWGESLPGGARRVAHEPDSCRSPCALGISAVKGHPETLAGGQQRSARAESFSGLRRFPGLMEGGEEENPELTK